jgi:hypothetical protein
MKSIALAALLISSSAFADLCSRYNDRPEYARALEALVTNHMNRDMNEVCNSARILDIEIQPSQIINQDGEVVPQMAIYFHYNEDSCKYLLNRADLTLTTSRCYPTW